MRSSKMIELNPLSMNEELLLGLLAAGLIGGGGYWWYKKGNPSITVMPGTQSVTAKVGGTVTLVLPAGAKWLLVGTANVGANATASINVAQTTSPYAVTNVTNGELITVSYTDSTGATQAATISVTAS